jgi:hypothetical protein
MSMSNFIENNMLNYILKTPGGNTSFIRPDPAGILYIGLFTNGDGLTPTYLETNTGTGAKGQNEIPDGVGYQRKQIIFGTNATNGIISNTNLIEWDPALVGWGIVTHFSIINIGITDFTGTLYWGAFDTPRNVLGGDKFIIYPGQLKVSMN